MKNIIFTLFILFLSGCATSYYGYDQATWDSMSPEEKEKTIEDVNKLKRSGREVDRQRSQTQSIINRAGAYSR